MIHRAHHPEQSTEPRWAAGAHGLEPFPSDRVFY